MSKQKLAVTITLESESIPDDQLAAALVDVSGPMTGHLWDWLKNNLPRFVGSDDFKLGIDNGKTNTSADDKPSR